MFDVFIHSDKLLALTKPAGVTLAATLFIDHRRLAAFGAQVADFHQRLAGRFADGGMMSVAPRKGGAAVRWAAGRASHRQADQFVALGLAVALFQVLVQHLAHAVGQGAHAVRAKAQRTPAADAAQLGHHLAQAVDGRDG